MGNAPSTSRDAPIYISSDSESSDSLNPPRGSTSALQKSRNESHGNEVPVSSAGVIHTLGNNSPEHIASAAANLGRANVEEQGKSQAQLSPNGKRAQAFNTAEVPKSVGPHQTSVNLKRVQGPVHQTLHQVGSSRDATKVIQEEADTRNEQDVPEVTLSDLRDLQLAIGRELVPFLPKYPALKFDEVTDEEDYLPIAVFIGTYNPGDPRSKINGLEIWAYHKIQDEEIAPNIKPHAPIDLVAFDKKGDHVGDLEGIGLESPWFEVKEHVDFLPEFAHLRSSAELLSLVRYCLLLAANAQLFGFDGSTVPKDMSFTRKLVDICHHRWDEQRLKTYEETGVYPEYHEIWKNAPKPRVPQREEVEMFSESEESSGEDEIPDLPPKPYKKHLKRRRG